MGVQTSVGGIETCLARMGVGRPLRLLGRTKVSYTVPVPVGDLCDSRSIIHRRNIVVCAARF